MTSGNILLSVLPLHNAWLYIRWLSVWPIVIPMWGEIIQLLLMYLVSNNVHVLLRLKSLHIPKWLYCSCCIMIPLSNVQYMNYWHLAPLIPGERASYFFNSYWSHISCMTFIFLFWHHLFDWNQCPFCIFRCTLPLCDECYRPALPR